MKVLAFVGTRADLFPLGPVLVGLEESADVELHIATAVGFEGGTSREVLLDAGLRRDAHTHHDLGLFLQDSTPAGQARLGAALSLNFLELVGSIEPDALVVLGDRWELLYAVPPALLMGIRVIHLHGGEVTEGALDERVRHALTKLADQHCVSTVGASRRVEQLGEDPGRIHHTGAPGLDRFLEATPLTDSEFEEEFHVPLRRPLIVGTYHPVTAGSAESPGVLARRVFESSLRMAGTLILTNPGFDAGREEILDVLAELQLRKVPNLVIRASLGRTYPRVMATADLMVGNSSSGIIEAASFELPAVDVGDRQKGRERGSNVIWSAENTADLETAISTALGADFSSRAADAANPYGDGRAAGRIVQVITDSLDEPMSKVFVDACVGGVQDEQ
ncbi:UDP-N-acetylglucosamine 2-epimerase [Arthrobacter tecti]